MAPLQTLLKHRAHMPTSEENRSTIMDDPFIREHIDEVLRSLRTQWILDVIKPYTRIEIAYLAKVRL